MAKFPARGGRAWIDAFALGGSINSMSQDIEQERAVVTCLADVGPRRLVGNYDHKHEHLGFFDGVALEFDPQAFVHLNTDEDHYLAQAFGSANEGDVVYEAIIRLREQVRSGGLGEAVLLNIQADGSNSLSRGLILRNAAVTGTGSGTGRNLGATVAGQTFQAMYRVLAVSGAGSITVRTYQSQNDGAGDAYTEIAGLAATFTAIGRQRFTTTAATEAWKQTVVSAFSGFTSVTLLATAGVVTGT